MDDISLTQAEYDLILHGHPWIRSVAPYASLSRGWAGLVIDMLDVLALVIAEVRAKHPDACLTEFSSKQKFGSLRVFFGLDISGPLDAIWPLVRAPVDRAEERSTRTCERCGAPGRLREIDDWLVTLCDAHVPGREDP